MSFFFGKKKSREVKNVIHRMLNGSQPGGRRADNRTTRVVVGIVIPIVDRRPQIAKAFTATTNDLSDSGVALVIDRPEAPEAALLGFHLSGKMVFFRAEAKYARPLGGGFHLHGYQLFEIVSFKDYPELESVKL